MDAAGRTSRWEKPFIPFVPKNEAERLRAVIVLGHIRRRPAISNLQLEALLGKTQLRRITARLQAGKLIKLHKSVRLHHNANYRSKEWIITSKGSQWYDRNIQKFDQADYEPWRGLNSWYQHAVGCTAIGVSFDIAADKYSLMLTYHATDPQNYDGLVPDEPPFSLRFTRQIDIAGWEYDRGGKIRSESLTVFGEKLDKWSLYYINRHYERHELKAPYTLIVTNSVHRRDALMDLVRDHINPRLWDRFLFKVIADFTEDETPPATGFIVEEPWQTIEGSPFYMLEEIGAWTPSGSKTSSDNERQSTSRLEIV